MNRFWHFGLGVVALLGIFPQHVAGNTFGDREYQLLRSLSERAQAFQRDIVESQRALLSQPMNYECSVNVAHDLEADRK